MKEVQLAQNTPSTVLDTGSEETIIDETPSDPDRTHQPQTRPRVIIINETKRESEPRPVLRSSSDVDSTYGDDSPVLKRDPHKPKGTLINRPPTGYGMGSDLVGDVELSSDVSSVSSIGLIVTKARVM
ncbi:unnamed protein product [Echinostoma caproni]|uniref:Polyprotein n=1 Tax=Echinostoma caproni TaxID=27848 RepID=A0A183B462_9TREM|nr:unnamed protein product [Echinostoma caproni]